MLDFAHVGEKLDRSGGGTRIAYSSPNLEIRVEVFTSPGPGEVRLEECDLLYLALEGVESLAWKPMTCWLWFLGGDRRAGRDETCPPREPTADVTHRCDPGLDGLRRSTQRDLRHLRMPLRRNWPTMKQGQR